MKLVATLLLGSMALAVSPAAEAQERRSSERRATAERGSQNGAYRRPSTEDRQGRCVRDNGRPSGSLDLNHRCDREEFWARFNDYGDGRQ